MLAVIVGTAAGCGSSAAPSAAPAVVVTQTVVAPPAETVTQTVQATVTMPASETPAETVEPSPSAVARPAAKITVPDAVGMNYQDAQDLWRAAGLHVAPANDATGAHRVPVLDRNWVVLAQDLKAGSKVPADSFITATIKKYTDG